MSVFILHSPGPSPANDEIGFRFSSEFEAAVMRTYRALVEGMRSVTTEVGQTVLITGPKWSSDAEDYFFYLLLKLVDYPEEVQQVVEAASVMEDIVFKQV